MLKVKILQFHNDFWDIRNSLTDVHRTELHPTLICRAEYAELREEKYTSLSLKALELTEYPKETDQCIRGRIFYTAPSEHKTVL